MEPYRLLSIDPDTDTLGVSILSYDFVNKQINLEFAYTMNASKDSKRYKLACDVHGNRYGRLHSLQEALTDLMFNFNIHGVVSECPYMGRFPQAFAALTECLSCIRAAIVNYDPLLMLHEIDPSTVKMHVGVNGKSGDKDLMFAAIDNLLSSGRIRNNGNLNHRLLDQHAIDAIAVGYGHMRNLFS